MNSFRNPKALMIAIVTLGIIIYLANSGNVFGKFINKFLPCQQDLATSFPCFAVYDLSIMAIAGLSIVVCVLLLFLKRRN